MICKKLRIALFVLLMLISTSCVQHIPQEAYQAPQKGSPKEGESYRERYSIITYERDIPVPGSPGTLISSETFQPYKSSCGKFELPERKPIPQLSPLTAEQARNIEHVSNVLIDHVKELRKYIQENDKVMEQQYRHYISSCE